MSTIDKLKENIGNEFDKQFISIDMKNANFSNIKTFDLNNELETNWHQLLNYLDINHSLIAESKSFRQVVFGNLNPKRNGKIQLLRMNWLAESLKENGLQDELIGLYNDEIVLINREGVEETVKKVVDQIRKEFNLYHLKFEVCKFQQKEIEKNIFLRKNDDQTLKLIGVPGNQFYIYYKNYILNQPLEEKDLYFINDGKLAKWVV